MNNELSVKLEENVTCSICLERYKWPLTLAPCLHSYCRFCLVDYADKFSQSSPSTTTGNGTPDYSERKIQCPDCRTVVTLPASGIDGLAHNHTLQSIVDNLALHEQRLQNEQQPQPPISEENKKGIKREEENVAGATAAATTPLQIDENKEEKKTQNINLDENENSITKKETESPEEDLKCCSMSSSSEEVFDKKACKPPRPPPPKLPEPPISNTMLYPDITNEKAILQRELNAIERPMDFDPCKDGLLFKFGKYGGGVNDFRKPYGLATGPEGDVFVSDTAGNRILHFSEDGKFLNKVVADCDIHDIGLFPNGLLLAATSKARNAILRMYSLNGAIRGEYSGLHYNYAKPSGVAIGLDNYAVVTSLEKNCVYVFTEQQKLSKSFGWKGAGNEHFNAPAFVTTNRKNYVIVSDMGNHCLKVFTMEGTFKYSFGIKGKDNGMLMNPMGVCTDNDNNIIVADAGNFRVQAFSSKGRPLGCPLQDTFRIGPNVRPINVSMDRRNNIVVLLLGSQFAEVRTYLWTPPAPDALQDSLLKFTGSSMSKMFENIAGSF